MKKTSREILERQPDWLTFHPAPITEVEKSTSVSLTEIPPNYCPTITIASYSKYLSKNTKAKVNMYLPRSPAHSCITSGEVLWILQSPAHPKPRRIFATTDPNNNEELTMLNSSDEKPISIPPPGTLREARQSPWWPQIQKQQLRPSIEGTPKKSNVGISPAKSSIPYGKKYPERQMGV